MKQEITTLSTLSAPLSRRDFLAASMASVALAAFDRYGFADTNPGRAQTLSSESFEQASRRAEELVHRMTLEEVTQQLVHHAPALPKLELARYNYWSEALH